MDLKLKSQGEWLSTDFFEQKPTTKNKNIVHGYGDCNMREIGQKSFILDKLKLGRNESSSGDRGNNLIKDPKEVKTKWSVNSWKRNN